MLLLTHLCQVGCWHYDGSLLSLGISNWTVGSSSSKSWSQVTFEYAQHLSCYKFFIFFWQQFPTRIIFNEVQIQPSEIHLKRNCDSGRIAWHMSNKLSCCDVCHTEYIALTPTHCCNATGKRLAEHNLSLYSSGMLKRKNRVKFMRQTQQHLRLALLVEATKGVRSIRLTINTWARVFGFFFWNTNRWEKNLSRY